MCMAGIIDVSLTAVNITQTHIHTHTHAHTHPSRLDKGVVQTGPLNAQQMKKTCSSISPVQRTQATEMGQRWVSVCVPMCVYMQATEMGQRWVSVLCAYVCLYAGYRDGPKVSECMCACVCLSAASSICVFVRMLVCSCVSEAQRFWVTLLSLSITHTRFGASSLLLLYFHLSQAWIQIWPLACCLLHHYYPA